MNNNPEKPIVSQSLVETKKEISPSVETIKSLATKYPEMGWLTGNTDATPEASISDQAEGTIGKHIFPNLDKKDLIEFDEQLSGYLL
ncbi:MAG: hypothetical protein AAB421_02475 [Patescibacteria group bacterium]